MFQQLIKQFTQGVTQTSRGRRQLEHRLLALIDSHFEHPDRRDGRGRRAEDLRSVKKALQHMNHAIAWRNRQDLDVNVRREAQALVKTICHAREPFEGLMARASRLRGRVNKSGKARNDRKPIEGCKPLREALPQGFALERLHTVEQLRHAGLKFGNCAKDNLDGLHDKLRQRALDFYLILRGNEPVAMVEVELKTNKIGELLGQQNSDVELPREVLIAMLRRLQLDGDDVEACLQQGAAWLFATGAADMRRPDWQRGSVMVWRGPRRILVKETQCKHGRWTSLKWDGSCWDSSYGSKRYRLDDLMTRYPSLAKLARNAVKLGCEQ